MSSTNSKIYSFCRYKSSHQNELKSDDKKIINDFSLNEDVICLESKRKEIEDKHIRKNLLTKALSIKW